jgi:hypothetical protein
MKRMVKAMPTMRGCSGRIGQTSNRVMLLRPRRFSTPVSVEVPTLASTSRRSLDSSFMRFPSFLRSTLSASRHRCANRGFAPMPGAFPGASANLQSGGMAITGRQWLILLSVQFTTILFGLHRDQRHRDPAPAQGGAIGDPGADFLGDHLQPGRHGDRHGR